MARFLRTWLVPILALLMMIGISVTFVPLTQQAETRADMELAQLSDRAFARIKEGAHAADPVIAAQEENLLSKANAVSRFLAHDDALLASDALKAFCEQFKIDRIDVADALGMLIASSDETRVNVSLGAQDAFTWTMAAADNAEAALTKEDESIPSVLFACVGRTDIEGFVLLMRDDPYVADALAKSTPEALISDLAYGRDVLFLPAASGEDGFFRESGNLCLRRTQDGVTLIAARPLNEVFAVRNGALCAFGAALVCIVICGVAAYLLRLEPVISLEAGDPALEAAEEPAGLLAEESGSAEEETPKTNPRRRIGRTRKPEPAAEPDSEDELAAQHEQAVEHAPQQAGRGRRETRTADETILGDADQRNYGGADSFEKIVE